MLLLLAATSSAVAQGPSCAEGGHFDDFDFWLGEWDVTNNANGDAAGSNLVVKEVHNCLVMENWTSVNDTTGKSINYYDAGKEQWRQVWVAPGYSIDITGGLAEGAMTLVGEISYANGTIVDFRGTWTPNEDGTVRQFFEQFDPDSETWTVWFDGKYTRRP